MNLANLRCLRGPITKTGLATIGRFLSEPNEGSWEEAQKIVIDGRDTLRTNVSRVIPGYNGVPTRKIALEAIELALDIIEANKVK